MHRCEPGRWAVLLFLSYAENRSETRIYDPGMDRLERSIRLELEIHAQAGFRKRIASLQIRRRGSNHMVCGVVAVLETAALQRLLHLGSRCAGRQCCAEIALELVRRSLKKLAVASRDDRPQPMQIEDFTAERDNPDTQYRNQRGKPDGACNCHCFSRSIDS